MVTERHKEQVRIRMRDEGGTPGRGEWLWAERVQQNGPRGIHCLLNTAFFAPFAVGDMVETRRKRNGDLVVTGLHRRGGRTAHLLVFRLDVDEAAVRQLADSWAATGSWVEGSSIRVLTVAVERSAGGRPNDADLADLAAGGLLESVVLSADPADTPDHEVFRDLAA